MFFDLLFDFLFRILFELIWTPLFYGPGWLVCALTPFWRERALALLREPFWIEPRPERREPFYSDAANTVALIGFCATILIGGAAYGAHLLRG